jgi:hypothetical protein
MVSVELPHALANGLNEGEKIAAAERYLGFAVHAASLSQPIESA